MLVGQAVAKSPDFEPERLDAMEEDLDKIMEVCLPPLSRHSWSSHHRDELPKLRAHALVGAQGIAEIDYNLYSTAFVGTEEVAGGLRVEGKIALDRILGTYKKFTETIQILL